MRHWFGEVSKYATKNTSKLLIGNKIDMVDNIRVSDSEGKVRFACFILRDVAKPRHYALLVGSRVPRDFQAPG